jgi:hypothetical protein
MKQAFYFNPFYFFWTIPLLVIEILIAKYVHDKIIRPYGGDFLVVILIYCFIKSFFNTSIKWTAIGVLLFSFLVETLQYFHIINKLGLEKSKFARTIIGTSFAWTDIIMYTLGVLTIVLVEYRIAARFREIKQ